MQGFNSGQYDFPEHVRTVFTDIEMGIGAMISIGMGISGLCNVHLPSIEEDDERLPKFNEMVELSVDVLMQMKRIREVYGDIYKDYVDMEHTLPNLDYLEENPVNPDAQKS